MADPGGWQRIVECKQCGGASGRNRNRNAGEPSAKPPDCCDVGFLTNRSEQRKA